MPKSGDFFISPNLVLDDEFTLPEIPETEPTDELLYITDLNGNTEPLTDFRGLARRRRINGEKTLDLTVVPTENNEHAFDLVKEESIITFDKEDYVIKTLEQISVKDTQIKQATAIHKFYVDMINNPQSKIHNGSLTFKNWCEFVFKDSGYEYVIVGSFNAKTFENLGNDSRLSLLQNGLKRYKAEIEIKYNTVFLHNLIGADTDLQFRYGHNIKSINPTTDTTNLTTIIHGEWEDGMKLTFRSDNADYFGELGVSKTFDDERFTTRATRLKAMEEALQDTPIVSIPIDFVDLRKAGYPHLVPNEGDNVFVIYEPMDDLLIETRVLEINEVFSVNLEPIKTDVVLSNYLKTFAGTMFDKVDKQFSEIVEDGIIKYNVLDQAVRIATEALLSAQTELIFDNGIIARDKNNPNLLVLLNSKGIGISDNGGQTFREAITADGFVLSAGAIGRLSANHIQLGSGMEIKDGYKFDDKNIGGSGKWNKQGTYIDESGVYTGLVVANQVRTGIMKSQNDTTTFNLNDGNLRFNHHDGSYTRIGISGMERWVASDRQNYHYLFHARSFVYGSASGGPRWIQLPNDFKGKQFKIYFAISDSMNVPNYYYAIQRFVCTQHPDHSIDYANARVPVIAYKSSTKSDGIAPVIDEVQGVLFAIY